MLNASMCVTTRGSPPLRGGLGIPSLKNLGRESTLMKVPCSLYAIMATKKEGAPRSSNKETSITVEIWCFAANSWSRPNSLQIGYTCVPYWLHSGELGLAAWVGGVPAAQHCQAGALVILPLRLQQISLWPLWAWPLWPPMYWGCQRGWRIRHLKAKGPQCGWAPLTPSVASKYRGQLGHRSVFHLGTILFSLPVIFIFSLENGHLS